MKKYFLLLYLSLGLVFAESDGVWDKSQNVRVGTFGADEGDTTSPYIFQNPVYFINANVGIGNQAPTQKLDVTGNLKVSGSISSSSITNTGSINSGSLSTGTATISSTLSSNTATINRLNVRDYIMFSNNVATAGTGGATPTDNYIGNSGTHNAGGNLDMKNKKILSASEITSSKFCIGTNCITSWPSSSRGVSLPICSNEQVLKYNSGNWICGTDLTSSGTGGTATTPTLSEVLGQGNDAGGFKITNLGQPTADNDAATMKYVNDKIATIRGTGTGGSTPGSSLWTQSGNNIYYNSGKVGIGTITPTQSLHVEGNGLITGNLLVGTGSFTSEFGAHIKGGIKIEGSSNIAGVVITSNGVIGTNGNIITLDGGRFIESGKFLATQEYVDSIINNIEYKSISMPNTGNYDISCNNGKKAISCGTNKHVGGISSEDSLGCYVDINGCHGWLDLDGSPDGSILYCVCI